MDVVDAVSVRDALTANGVDVCAGGGRAVDALLGEQTREHSDLDVWVPADSFERAVAVFAGCGVVPGRR